MFTPLPQSSEVFERAGWPAIEAWYHELLTTPLTRETLGPWMAQWSRLSALVDETMTWLSLAVHRDTADEECARRKERFIDEVFTSSSMLSRPLALSRSGATICGTPSLPCGNITMPSPWGRQRQCQSFTPLPVQPSPSTKNCSRRSFNWSCGQARTWKCAWNDDHGSPGFIPCL